MRWSCLSIPNRLNMEMDRQHHPTNHDGYNYESMVEFKFIRVNKHRYVKSYCRCCKTVFWHYLNLSKCFCSLLEIEFCVHLYVLTRFIPHTIPFFKYTEVLFWGRHTRITDRLPKAEGGWHAMTTTWGIAGFGNEQNQAVIIIVVVVPENENNEIVPSQTELNGE